MNFINNWRQQLALAQSAASVELELPDGEYLLTLSDGLGAAATRWEYIRATLASGTAALQRGDEGSTAQDWPAGSWISCSITAGTMSALFSEMASLRSQVLALQAGGMPGEAIQVLAGQLENSGRTATGWLVFPGGGGAVGSGTPQSITPPGQAQLDLVGVYVVSEPGAETLFIVEMDGDATLAGIESVSAAGIGTLLVVEGTAPYFDSSINRTSVFWTIESFDWVDGERRGVKFNY